MSAPPGQGGSAPRSGGGPSIRYALSMPEPHTHLLHVTIEASDLGGPYADFVMPAWSPGSYKVRDYAKHDV